MEKKLSTTTDDTTSIPITHYNNSKSQYQGIVAQSNHSSSSQSTNLKVSSAKQYNSNNSQRGQASTNNGKQGNNDLNSNQIQYNFIVKGAKIDSVQPTKEEIQEYEQFKVNMTQEQKRLTDPKLHTNDQFGSNQPNGLLSDNDDSSSSSSLENLNNDMNEDLMVLEESFDDEDDGVFKNNLNIQQHKYDSNLSMSLITQSQNNLNNNVQSGTNTSEILNNSNQKVNLVSRYAMKQQEQQLLGGAKKNGQNNDVGSETNSPKKNKQSIMNEDVLFLNNGNKDMDLSTKIAPESDRQIDDKNKKKRQKSVKPKGVVIPVDDTDGKKKKKKGKQKRLIMNISQTKYYVVRYVAKKIYGMRLTHNDDEDWDIMWQDGAVNCERLYKMKPYQRVNHFAGMYALARKNHLARNLGRMQKKFPDDYKFFPQTYLLPSEYSDFRNQFNNKKKMNKTFIVKPEASCQGRVDPLRIYMYKEGLSRFATEIYVPPNGNNLDNLYMHLTNYAINKTSSKFIQNKNEDADNIGHKRSLTYVWRYLEEQGHDVERVIQDVKETIIKTICAVQPQLAHIYKSCQPDDVENSMCYEILGFDIFFDDKLKPWILEVNHSPSFSTDSPLDFKIKKNLISDTIRLLNLSYTKKQMYKKQKQIEFQKRALKGKPRITQEERETIRQKRIKKRDNFEKKNLGDYDLIFPSEKDTQEDYQKFLSFAKVAWEDFNQGSFKKKQQQENPAQSTLNVAQETGKGSIINGSIDKNKQSLILSAQKSNSNRPQSSRRESKAEILPRKDSLKELSQTVYSQSQDPNHMDHKGLLVTLNEKETQLAREVFISKQSKKLKADQLDLTDAKLNPSSVIQATSLTLHSSQNINQSSLQTKPLLQIHSSISQRYSDDGSLGKNTSLLSKSQQNKDPNIQSKNSSQSVGSIYKNVYSNAEKNISLKPINTFEKFLKNLTQTSATQLTNLGDKQTSNSAQNLSSLPQSQGGGRQSFQYEADMNIKSMNSSGILKIQNSNSLQSQDISTGVNNQYQNTQQQSTLLRPNQLNNTSSVTYKPRGYLQNSADRGNNTMNKRAQSQNRVSSAKVQHNQNILQRGINLIQGKNEVYQNTVLTSSNNSGNVNNGSSIHSQQINYRNVNKTGNLKDHLDQFILIENGNGLMPQKQALQSKLDQQWQASQKSYNPRMQYPHFKYSSFSQNQLEDNQSSNLMMPSSNFSSSAQQTAKLQQNMSEQILQNLLQNNNGVGGHGIALNGQSISLQKQLMGRQQ
eukprot:403371481